MLTFRGVVQIYKFLETYHPPMGGTPTFKWLAISPRDPQRPYPEWGDGFDAYVLCHRPKTREKEWDLPPGWVIEVAGRIGSKNSRRHEWKFWLPNLYFDEVRFICLHPVATNVEEHIKRIGFSHLSFKRSDP